MRTPNPSLTLAAFGLNVVDSYADDFAGWTVPPLQACCNDAAAWVMLGALSDLSSSSFISSYVGRMSGLGPNLPPYRLALDCTRGIVRGQIAGRAGYVTQLMREGKEKNPLSVICVSGHGAQEVYPLETVESLVLSDGLMPDFEFHNLLAQFPAGARVAVFLDTCHSGGMDRAASFRFRQKFAGTLTRTDEDGRPLREVQPKSAIQANVAVFAACPKDATALDGQHNGAFTASYMRAAGEAIERNTRPSWLDVFHQAATNCVRDFRQQPVATFYGEQSVWDQPFMK